MKEWIEKHRNEFLVGIIVFIITSALSRAWHYVMEYGQIAGGSFLSFVRDSIYKEAAKQSGDSIVAAIFSFAFGFFLVYMFGFIIRSFRVAKEELLLKETNKTIEELNNFEEGDPNKDEKIKEAKKLLETSKRYISKRKKGTPQKLRGLLVILSVVVCYYAIHLTLFTIVPSSLWHRFERSVTQITPYTEKESIDTLRSQWVSMNSKEDYDVIMKYINQIRAANGLKKL